ncbi:hypothetical protein HU200_047060 [Digitaria exilis]|uniref:RWD domain-containing protein n=1 Tax=Digitaria exilis TaxID=1010633 RepID=A0A835EC05_9POAL|nr:hypothetical protein HU200_047060 [Digitaria exilis]
MAAQAEAEEEVRLELEAVAAVYGDDVRVLHDLPPHLVVHVRPRTADDSSQQFVELFLGIKASSQYPKEPPHIYAVESKGLDENRQSYLISSIENKAKELSNYQMLVALCEQLFSNRMDSGLIPFTLIKKCHMQEAGEILSNMNHPAGDCPLCLYPLVGKDKDGSEFPFMKLMSCYHCFHRLMTILECIMRWWEWLQHSDANPKERNTGGVDIVSLLSIFVSIEIWSTSLLVQPIVDVSKGFDLSSSDKHYNVNQHKGFCPVCRKVFDGKDIEHVRDLLGECTSHMVSLTLDLGEDEKELLYSEAEQIRRKRIESLVNMQQEHNGLIEPKKDLAIQPGMYVTLPSSTADTATEENADPSEETTTSTSGTEQLSQANNTTSTTKPKNSGYRRRNRANASRRQPHGQPGRQQWQRKEADNLQQ